MLSEALNACLYSEHEALTPNNAIHRSFTDYVGVDNSTGEAFFVVDLLTYDYSLLNKMKFNYKQEWLDKGIHKVKVVCFEAISENESTKSLIIGTLRNENIEVVEAKFGMFLNKYLPKMEPKKIGQNIRYKELKNTVS